MSAPGRAERDVHACQCQSADASRYASAYSRAAKVYAQVLDPTLRPVAQQIVDLAELRSGDRLLDVATGTGLVARAAAERGAAVSGLDIAAGMIEAARRHSSSSVEFVCGDAASLPFADDEFDVVTCGFGLSHMPDPAAVLNEVRRVLRGDGRFVASSWGSDGENEAVATTRRILEAAPGGKRQAFSDLDEETWADPARGAVLLACAGFDVEVVTDRLTGRHDTPSVALEWALAWPTYGEAAASLSESERASFETTAGAEIAKSDLSWWYAVNYYVATKTPEPPTR